LAKQPPDAKPLSALFSLDRGMVTPAAVGSFPALVSLFLSPPGHRLPIPAVMFVFLVRPFVTPIPRNPTSKRELGTADVDETAAVGSSGDGRRKAKVVSGQFLAGIWLGR
jgi:hypothetical protein